MDEPSLSIGELARSTGVSAATLRTWESRHGFPLPLRLNGGHRRYSPAQVAAVLEVCRRRDAGMRLDVAIGQVAGDAALAAPPALFAGTVTRHPGQPRQRLRKQTLIRLSHAIEDEVAAGVEQAHLFGSFQSASHYAAARLRWNDLAVVAADVHAFADFGRNGSPADADAAREPFLVALPPEAPLLREWAVVCDAPELPVAMLASEVPGQTGVPPRKRVFEATWTVDPAVVRDVSRRCAEIAAAAGSRRARDLLLGPLGADPSASAPSPLVVSRLLLGVVGRLDAD